MDEKEQGHLERIERTLLDTNKKITWIIDYIRQRDKAQEIDNMLTTAAEMVEAKRRKYEEE